MKTRYLLTLPLAAALTLPALAQQSTAQPAQKDQTTATAPATAPGSQTNDQANQAQLASGKQPLTYESRQGFWGKINPFARKKYVQRQLQPVRDRVNELDELTAANTRNIRDVDSRAQQGIQQASAKANEADSHAVDAGNRAQQANQTAQQASQQLQTVSTVVGSLDQYEPATSVEIRFRPGQVVLSKKAKDALDELATATKDQKGYIIEVQGFSSGRGVSAIRNSENMADSVVRYLVEAHEVPIYRIYTLGMGNAPVPAAQTEGKTRRTVGGRVQISLMKNSIAGLNQMASNNGTAQSVQTGGVSGATSNSTPSNQQQVSQPAGTPAAPVAQPQQPPATPNQQPPQQ